MYIFPPWGECVSSCSVLRHLSPTLSSYYIANILMHNTQKSDSHILTQQPNMTSCVRYCCISQLWLLSQTAEEACSVGTSIQNEAQLVDHELGWFGLIFLSVKWGKLTDVQYLQCFANCISLGMFPLLCIRQGFRNVFLYCIDLQEDNLLLDKDIREYSPKQDQFKWLWWSICEHVTSDCVKVLPPTGTLSNKKQKVVLFYRFSLCFLMLLVWITRAGVLCAYAANQNLSSQLKSMRKLVKSNLRDLHTFANQTPAVSTKTQTNMTT